MMIFPSATEKKKKKKEKARTFQVTEKFTCLQATLTCRPSFSSTYYAADHYPKYVGQS